MSELDWLDDEERGLENATMTNREWLFSLNNKDLAKVLHEAPFECCSVCPHDGVDCLGADDCMDAIEPWLEAKHEEG